MKRVCHCCGSTVELPSGADLRARRRKLGLTMYQVARLLGVHYTYISKIETGTMRLSFRMAREYVALLAAQ